MITLYGKDGCIMTLDENLITAYGLDPKMDARLWIICDGKEYVVTENAEKQIKLLDKHVKNEGRPIGIKEYPNVPDEPF